MVSDIRTLIGPFGVWWRARGSDGEFARRLESAGYGALWLGGSPGGDLVDVETLLDATETLVVGTGIVNIWRVAPHDLAAAYQRVIARHPHRFVLGIGTGHPEKDDLRAARPITAMNEYLDALDAEGVPSDARVIAALGPAMVKIAAERSAGAHPYLGTPEHTRRVRNGLGEEPLLLPEQRVVLEPDPETARALARPGIETPYLGLSNYRKNLARLGYSEGDMQGDGSDRLIDDLVVFGTPEVVVVGLRKHLDAGADHVAVQVVPRPSVAAIDDYEVLAKALRLA